LKLRKGRHINNMRGGWHSQDEEEDENGTAALAVYAVYDEGFEKDSAVL
jgi:hypothetical protein